MVVAVDQAGQDDVVLEVDDGVGGLGQRGARPTSRMTPSTAKTPASDNSRRVSSMVTTSAFLTSNDPMTAPLCGDDVAYSPASYLALFVINLTLFAADDVLHYGTGQGGLGGMVHNWGWNGAAWVRSGLSRRGLLNGLALGAWAAGARGALAQPAPHVHPSMPELGVVVRPAAPPTLQPLSEPQVRASANGLLQTSLRAAYGYRDVGGFRLFVRGYEGGSPGPTLRMKPGDTLKLG